MGKSYPKKLRLPMRCVNGAWELTFGGAVDVRHGAEAELLVKVDDIEDENFVERMLSKSSIKVLDRGATLRAYVSTKNASGLTEQQRQLLKSWKDVGSEIAPGVIDSWSSGPLSFVDIALGDAIPRQAQLDGGGGGGLWLMTEGAKAVGLQSSLIDLPGFISKEPAISLNHAFTLLSEVYESWRKSHTGNVYQRFLYREKNGKWYPLETLRDAKLAEKEQEIAASLWERFMQRMAGP